MTTPNMNLTLPVVSQTPGPTWASDINADLSVIDEHNHTSGKGALVPVAGLDIDSDLSLATHALTDVTKAVLLDQALVLTANAVYAVGGDLYWTNGSGTAVQITSGNTIAVGATGNIGGLPDGLAAVNYDDLVFAYRFKDSVGANAGIVVGPVISSKVTIDSVSIDTPVGVSTYQLTVASALPVNTSFLTCTSTGQIGYTSQTNGVTRPMLAVVDQQISTFTSNTVTGAGNMLLPITIQTTGRPVFVGFTNAVGDAQANTISLDDTSGANFVNATVAVAISSASPPPGFTAGNYLKNKISGYVSATSSPVQVPASSISGIVVLPAGTYTMQCVLTALTGTGSPQFSMTGSLFAYEL
jgi:hypothetical protein